MRKSILCTLLFFCGGIMLLSAQDKAPKPQKAEKKVEKKEQLPDYSKGFVKFYKFGLPDVKKAKYIKLQAFSLLNMSDTLRYQAKIDGNAWLISEDKKAGKATVVINNGALVTVYDQAKLLKAVSEKRRKEAEKGKKSKKRSAMSFSMDDMTDGKISGTWAKADLAKDTAKIIKYLKEGLTKKHFWGGDSFGSWFLFAIHLNQKGMKKEANELAGLLFELGKGKRKVILQALNAMADAQYNAAYAEFKSSHDWKKYDADVQRILNKFRKGWKKAQGVKMLGEMLQQRVAAGKKIKNPPGLSSEDIKLLDELNNSKLERFTGKLWVIADKKAKDDDDEIGIVEKITSRKMKSIPMLIALLGDKQLLNIDKDNFGNIMSRFSSRVNRSYASRNSQDAQSVFRYMKRPMTRGEFARKLLDIAVTKELEIDDKGREVFVEPEEDDTKDFKGLAENWYKKNKDKNNIDLANYYLSKGNQGQKNQAVNFLLLKKIKASYPVIEKYLLKGPRPEYGNEFKDQLAVTYAGRRGAAAKNFAKMYISLLDPDGKIREAAKAKEANDAKPKKKKKTKAKNAKGEMFVNDNDEENGEVNLNNWQTKQALQVIEKLQGLTSDETVEDIIDDLLSGKKKLDQKNRNLLNERMRLIDKDIDTKLDMLLKGSLKAAKLDKGKAAMDFLVLAWRTAKGHLYPSFNRLAYLGIEQDNEEEIKPADPQKNKEVWLKLLESKTPYKDTRENFPVNIGELAGFYSEIIYGDTEYQKLYQPIPFLGKKYYQRMVERSKARFKGVTKEKLPRLPSMDDMNEEKNKSKLEKMTERVKTVKDTEKFIKELDLGDMLILKKVLDKESDQNKKFVPIANEIISVKSSLKDGKEFAKYKGKVLSASMIEEIRKYAFNKLKEKKNIDCRIFKNACFEGIDIEISEQKPEENDEAAETGKIMLAGLINIPGAFYTKAYWDQKAPATKEEKKPEKAEEGDDIDDLFNEMEEDIQTDAKDFYSDKQKRFNEIVKKLEAGKLNSVLTGGIYFSGERQ